MVQPHRYPIPHLRAWRLAQIKSQEQLAKEAGIGAATIVRLEKPGEKANELTIYRLAKALKISPRKLLEEPPPEVLEEEGAA